MALAAALAAPGAASATTVLVMSITGSGVEILVNNSVVRTLRPGESSPEGVKLIDLGSGAALIEVDGRRWLMPLGSSTATTLVLQADERGHFIVTAAINGIPVRALVDTGASSIAMNLSDARRAGVNLSGARRVRILTASGAREALLVQLGTVQVGDIVVNDVEATLSERDELPITLLGMSFLKHLDMYRIGASLTLTLRH
ncbi:MAG TPA: TIGR02281 family clan AA aspartic protease [Burkholderiales bacterium]|nr:TIGR02281 family clan AA aspartic protease [Burkholderiales bacterium]